MISNSRCLPGSNRRRHKRESVSERLTHGGSLQNLAQPITSEFDSSFAYLTSGSCHTYGSSRRKNKKYTGPSVSARQREGGSLPSNVNASHSLASLANLDLLFDKKVFIINILGIRCFANNNCYVLRKNCCICREEPIKSYKCGLNVINI